jgi:hypothetical protein
LGTDEPLESVGTPRQHGVEHKKITRQPLVGLRSLAINLSTLLQGGQRHHASGVHRVRLEEAPEPTRVTAPVELIDISSEQLVQVTRQPPHAAVFGSPDHLRKATLKRQLEAVSQVGRLGRDSQIRNLVRGDPGQERGPAQLSSAPMISRLVSDPKST